MFWVSKYLPAEVHALLVRGVEHSRRRSSSSITSRQHHSFDLCAPLLLWPVHCGPLQVGAGALPLPRWQRV